MQRMFSKTAFVYLYWSAEYRKIKFVFFLFLTIARSSDIVLAKVYLLLRYICPKNSEAKEHDSNCPLALEAFITGFCFKTLEILFVDLENSFKEKFLKEK